MKTKFSSLALALALAALNAPAQSSTNPIPVTPDNFCRAETDLYFQTMISRGEIGKFYHFRDLPEFGKTIVHPNRDTFYSEGIFDLDAGPVTITLPDPGKRFISTMVINEDHYVCLVTYGHGPCT
jgi:hypothetical protein